MFLHKAILGMSCSYIKSGISIIKVACIALGILAKGFRSNFGILLSKLFWPTVRKNYSSDREKLLKFEAEGREFAKFLRSLEQFIQTVKGQNNFW